MNKWEKNIIAASIGAAMAEHGMDKSSAGGKALFCIGCVAAEHTKAGQPWSPSGMAQNYAEFSHTKQINVWQNIRRAIKRAGWDVTVGNAIYLLARVGERA